VACAAEIEAKKIPVSWKKSQSYQLFLKDLRKNTPTFIISPKKSTLFLRNVF
jgi:hypothetical protein